MEAVRPVVAREVVRHAVERELAACDAVRVSPDERAEVRMLAKISGQTIEAEGDVLEMSVAVRRTNGGDDRAVSHCANHDAARVGEREDIHGATVRQAAIRRACHRRSHGRFHVALRGAAGEGRDRDDETRAQRGHLPNAKGREPLDREDSGRTARRRSRGRQATLHRPRA